MLPNPMYLHVITVLTGRVLSRLVGKTMMKLAGLQKSQSFLSQNHAWWTVMTIWYITWARNVTVYMSRTPVQRPRNGGWHLQFMALESWLMSAQCILHLQSAIMTGFLRTIREQLWTCAELQPQLYISCDQTPPVVVICPGTPLEA